MITLYILNLHYNSINLKETTEGKKVNKKAVIIFVVYTSGAEEKYLVHSP